MINLLSDSNAQRAVKFCVVEEILVSCCVFSLIYLYEL